jgi:hypothetical protein
MQSREQFHMPHAYNAENISPRDFLLAVARDPKVRLKHRAAAAAHLARIYGEVLTQVVISIGGLPEIIDTWHCRDINDCRRRTSPCPWSAVIQSMQGVRFRPCAEELEQNAKNPKLN